MIVEPDERQNWIRGRRERRKQARTARLRRQILRYCLLLVLLAVGMSAFLYLPWRLADPDRDIVVSGNQVVAVEQVRGVLANCAGKPLYSLNPELLERQVRSLEAVRYAFVRRHLLPRPHLVVHVLEEFPWATVAPAPGEAPLAVISQTGSKISLKEFPTIFQPELQIYAGPDLRLSAADVRHWHDWITYIAAETGQKVEYVDMRQRQDIRVQTADMYLNLGSSDSTLTRRLGRLASLMPVIPNLDGELEYVELSLDNNIPLKLAQKEGAVVKTRPRPGPVEVDATGGRLAATESGTL